MFGLGLLRRFLTGDWPITQADIRRHAPAATVILEAGAAGGEDTVIFANTFPHGTVHAFEPVEMNYSLLTARVAGLANVKTYRLALSDQDGHADIIVSHDRRNNKAAASSSSLLKPQNHLTTHPHIEFTRTETVPTRTIDSWAAENNVDHIDILWLDMQGIEHRVLKASPRMLKTARVICTEVNLTTTYEGVTLYQDYKAWLNGQGFRVVREALPWKDAGNVLFVRG